MQQKVSRIYAGVGVSQVSKSKKGERGKFMNKNVTKILSLILGLTLVIQPGYVRAEGGLDNIQESNFSDTDIFNDENSEKEFIIENEAVFSDGVTENINEEIYKKSTGQLEKSLDIIASGNCGDNLTCCAITISMSSFWCKSPKCPYIYLKIKILENKLLNFSNITGFSKNTIEGHT